MNEPMQPKRIIEIGTTPIQNTPAERRIKSRRHNERRQPSWFSRIGDRGNNQFLLGLITGLTLSALAAAVLVALLFR